MAITSHFKNSIIPTSALLSIGTKVALENKNFCPIWGLHNGAVGVVDEIILKKIKPQTMEISRHMWLSTFPNMWDLYGTKTIQL